MNELYSLPFVSLCPLFFVLRRLLSVSGAGGEGEGVGEGVGEGEGGRQEGRAGRVYIYTHIRSIYVATIAG